MTIPTTGTLSTTAYDTRLVIDRAYGALGLTPQQITSEKIQIAQDLLSLVLTDLINTAAPLWTIDKALITLIQGQRSYSLGAAVSDVHSAYYRTMNNVTPATVTSAPSSYTFDFGLNSSGGNNDTIVTSFQIQWSAGAVPVTLQSSEDGATWAQVGVSGITNSSGTGTIWYDTNNTNAQRYWRIIPSASYNGITITPPNTLSISSAGLYNTPADVQMYRMNRDDYLNLTDQTIQGRPLQYFLNRGLSPNIAVWQSPNALAAQNLMVVIRKRNIMDVGSLQQALELPTRWFYTIIFALGDALAFCTPEAKPDRIALVQARAQQMLKTTWTEERDKSPFKMQFNLRSYTR